MDDRETGFTLIELMVVVLVVAVLLAIAIPTFLGARTAANDRAAQAKLRNAYTTQMVYFADAQEFTSSRTALAPLDASLSWTNTLSDLSRAGVTYVEITIVNARPAVVLGGRSDSGSCFWIRAVRDQNHPRFATDGCAGTGLVFSDSW